MFAFGGEFGVQVGGGHGSSSVQRLRVARVSEGGSAGPRRGDVRCGAAHHGRQATIQHTRPAAVTPPKMQQYAAPGAGRRPVTGLRTRAYNAGAVTVQGQWGRRVL